MIPPVAPSDPLVAFSAAWQECRETGALPTLGALKDKGAPLDDPGFAMLGRDETQHRGKSKAVFRVLAAGPDHAHWSNSVMVGQLLDEIVHPAHLESLIGLYNRLCEEKTLHRWRCMNMVRNAPPTSYTRVIAPIADDVGDGRCLAGIWVWHTPQARDAVAA
ncbi:MAG: hypothetical protein ACE37E_04340 [Hyphomicrobiales bacterium]